VEGVRLAATAVDQNSATGEENMAEFQAVFESYKNTIHDLQGFVETAPRPWTLFAEWAHKFVDHYNKCENSLTKECMEELDKKYDALMREARGAVVVYVNDQLQEALSHWKDAFEHRFEFKTWGGETYILDKKLESDRLETREAVKKARKAWKNILETKISQGVALNTEAKQSLNELHRIMDEDKDVARVFTSHTDVYKQLKRKKFSNAERKLESFKLACAKFGKTDLVEKINNEMRTFSLAQDPSVQVFKQFLIEQQGTFFKEEQNKIAEAEKQLEEASDSKSVAETDSDSDSDGEKAQGNAVEHKKKNELSKDDKRKLRNRIKNKTKRRKELTLSDADMENIFENLKIRQTEAETKDEVKSDQIKKITEQQTNFIELFNQGLENGTIEVTDLSQFVPEEKKENVKETALQLAAEGQ